MRTGGRSADVSLAVGTVSRAACAAAGLCSCAAAAWKSSPPGSTQTFSVCAAACVRATNICSIDGPRPGGIARSTSPTTAIAVLRKVRRILSLLR